MVYDVVIGLCFDVLIEMMDDDVASARTSDWLGRSLKNCTSSVVLL